jgi:hypothetical protein
MGQDEGPQIVVVSTREQAEAARERMNAAHRALLAYVTRDPSVSADDVLHKRLGEEFKHAHQEYGRLVAELGETDTVT